MIGSYKILTGDSVEMLKTLPDCSVQCCVTSPPYWGLRDYGVAGQLGLEKNPEEYVSKMVEVFREVRRVLKYDGVLWLNIGDSYAGSGRGRDADGTWNPGKGGSKQETNTGSTIGRVVNPKSFSKKLIEAGATGNAWVKPPEGLKCKDLVGIPWMLAFALRADGWYLRSDVIWDKPNPMPESVTDRPTKSHEYIFLLTKSSKYYYDAEAVREQLAESTLNDARNGTGRHTEGKNFSKYFSDESPDGSGADKPSWYRQKTFVNPEQGRNRRSVWHIATQPRKEAHFATFPDEIPLTCIKAGSSEKGQCEKCGSPWERVIVDTGKRRDGEVYTGQAKKDYADAKAQNPSDTKRRVLESMARITESKWQPTCKCNAATVPQTVLDPFAGSGTTGEIAVRLNRNAILIELSEKYVKTIMRPRLDSIAPLVCNGNGEERNPI